MKPLCTAIISHFAPSTMLSKPRLNQSPVAWMPITSVQVKGPWGPPVAGGGGGGTGAASPGGGGGGVVPASVAGPGGGGGGLYGGGGGGWGASPPAPPVGGAGGGIGFGSPIDAPPQASIRAETERSARERCCMA